MVQKKLFISLPHPSLSFPPVFFLLIYIYRDLDIYKDRERESKTETEHMIKQMR